MHYAYSTMAYLWICAIHSNTKVRCQNEGLLVARLVTLNYHVLSAGHISLPGPGLVYCTAPAPYEQNARGL